MCRHLAYIGPPVRVRDLLTTGEHSLVHQSYQPRDMRGGGVANADGYGAAWWDGPAAANSALPARYRSAKPIWADTAGLDALGAITSGAIVAAVRSATEGMPVIETACAPFLYREWAFSHNGYVAGWPGSLAEQAQALPVVDLMTLEAPTDSAVLWALIRREIAATTTAEAAVAVLADVMVRTQRAAPGSRLNFLASNGESVVATTCVHSLAISVTPESVLVASEPLCAAAEWQSVPDGHVVIAVPGKARIASVDEWKAA
ncbi:ergothioneine biosynthesis protein EgtC [Hoyosella sp. YIM 151337]|uniref:ergothioneine biosynthesis protein EgtC n=1 Tax=Hoyosella sp. YIM 151337 TaxID=2992742 RepID=UPI0022359D0A|nr:ergothioneine biosynthesis protein EgtC [Hoyosella sp. YIM 151337]MCW4352958.1 ergothioneine biosynthesis protein EgtC [Hoyosella sp. YIM 151337]